MAQSGLLVGGCHALPGFRTKHWQQAASTVSVHFQDSFRKITAANTNLDGSRGSVGQSQMAAGLAVIGNFCEKTQMVTEAAVRLRLYLPDSHCLPETLSYPTHKLP